MAFSLKNAFNAITESAKTLVTHPVESFLQGSAAVTAALAAPIQTAKNIGSEGVGAGLVTSIEEASQRSAVGNLARSVGSLAVVGAGTIAAGAVAGEATAISLAGAATRAVGSAAPIVIKGIGRVAANNPIATAVGLVSAPAIVETLIQSPSARDTALDLANPLSENKLKTGNDIAQVLEGDKTLTDFVGDHPLTIPLLAGGIITGAGLGLKTAAPLIGGILTNNAVNDLEKTLEESKSNSVIVPTTEKSNKTASDVAPSSSTSVPTPEIPEDKGVVAQPSADQGVPILSSDKKRSSSKRKRISAPTPVRITNKVEVRNINKLTVPAGRYGRH